MFCPSCGAAVEARDPFCRFCGFNLSAVQENTSTNNTVEPSAIPGPGFSMRLALLVVVGLCLFTYFGLSSLDRQSQPSSPYSRTEVDTAQQRRAREATETQHRQDSITIVTLRSQFGFKKDEVEGGGWYHFKAQPKGWDRSYIAANISDGGRIYLQSHFSGDSWIFHDHLVARIGERLITSDTIPSFSDLNVRNNDGGTVWEMLHLTDGKDNGILQAIATSTNEKIIVRFAGDQYHRDITLTETDRTAIKRSLAFAEALQRRPDMRAR